MKYGAPLNLSLGAPSGEINPLIFGHFIEFIENCIQGGVYDPASPASDGAGIRLDILEKAKGLQPAILRWPGGTYVNIYHWMDSIGPSSTRKKKRNLIWGGINDGGFGTAEFVDYCRRLGAEPMICVNMASGTAEEAANWVEYCNGQAGSYYADLRISHGYPEPFAVKYWCIGNESYAEPDLGPQHDPVRYIADAWEFIKHMKLTDPSIRLVIVGDTLNPSWNKAILDALHPVCDYFSIHHYSSEAGKGEYGPFLCLREFAGQLDELVPLLDAYSGKQSTFSQWYRFPPREDDIKLCLDEWNIWSAAPEGENNQYGLKAVYNWRDSLWTACMMNLVIRHAKTIAITNLAQLVNVIAPIVTNGDASYLQTTYHALKLYRDHARGDSLHCRADIPLMDGGAAGPLPAVDVSACRREDGTLSVFLANITKDTVYPITLEPGRQLLGSLTLGAPSFCSVNTPEADIVTVGTVEIDKEKGLCLLPPGTIAMLHIL